MMRHWIFKLCVPLASAAVLTGCTQEVSDSRTDRTTIDQATNQQRQDLRLAMTGCLGAGTGTNQYMLNHARPMPLAVQPSDAMSAANVTIPEDTRIRLASNDTEQLTELVGYTVQVQGILRSDGRNTIGTTGTARDAADMRNDRSQAATDQHFSNKVAQEAGPIGLQSMNNGTFPEMVVLQIKSTGERCVASPEGGH